VNDPTAHVAPGADAAPLSVEGVFFALSDAEDPRDVRTGARRTLQEGLNAGRGRRTPEGAPGVETLLVGDSWGRSRTAESWSETWLEQVLTARLGGVAERG